MKITHSIAREFARDGIGYIAYHRVVEAYRRGFLKKIIAASFFPSEIDKSCCIPLPLAQMSAKIITKIFPLPLSFTYRLRDRIFDWNASMVLPQADIFHTWSSQALLSIRKAKKRGQVAFLECATSHPLTMQAIVSEEYKKYNVPLVPIDQKLLEIQLKEFEEADFIIVPSRLSHESFMQHKIDDKKVLLIPFGVDTARFKPQPRGNDDVFRIGFVGQIGMRKGVHYLLEAFSELKLKNSELVLTGWVHPDITQILKKYSGVSNIVIKNFTLSPESVYHASSICVFPSIEDGFGLVVLEAMACGVPVIVTENVGAKDVVTNGEDGFVIGAMDVEALKEKIIYFYENREKMIEMGKTAKETSCLHTWENKSEILLSVYQNILGAKVKSGGTH